MFKFLLPICFFLFITNSKASAGSSEALIHAIKEGNKEKYSKEMYRLLTSTSSSELIGAFRTVDFEANTVFHLMAQLNDSYFNEELEKLITLFFGHTTLEISSSKNHNLTVGGVNLINIFTIPSLKKKIKNTDSYIMTPIKNWSKIESAVQSVFWIENFWGLSVKGMAYLQGNKSMYQFLDRLEGWKKRDRRFGVAATGGVVSAMAFLLGSISLADHYSDPPSFAAYMMSTGAAALLGGVAGGACHKIFRKSKTKNIIKKHPPPMPPRPN